MYNKIKQTGLVLRAYAILLSAFLPGSISHGAAITGDQWRVYFNHPDQDTYWTTATDDEFVIRNALVSHIEALENGDQATLATYSFSGNSECCGAAGPIIMAVNEALDRGAQVRMVVDAYVDINTAYDGGTASSYSLADLAARPTNPLWLSQDDSPWWGIMHDKLGLFKYSTQQWVFVTSWNFTGGASTYQWNIALAIQSPALYAACSNEMTQLLNGHFHDHSEKSHAPDQSLFDLPGSWSNGVVRFAPYPDESDGGTNAITMITNAIAQAQDEIYFALNKLTSGTIATQLVQAVERGVAVHGVMPRSDTAPGQDSAELYSFMTNDNSYAGSGRITMLPALTGEDPETYDSGESDLIHCKYMVIDPFGTRPTVIHGSANWTFSALASDDNNDEIVLCVRHRDIARMFYAQFKACTGFRRDDADCYLELAVDQSACRVDLWQTGTNQLSLQSAPTPSDSWQTIATNTINHPGSFQHATNNAASRCFRAVRIE
jgi:phosphatidylserine/phosphatidylglycerophosphate/cardiolipin synthase-like enzyme